MKRITLVLFTFIISLILINLYVGQINAFDYISRTDLGFDEKLSEQSTATYIEPSKILIAQITTNVDALANNSDVWIKQLYYYSITRAGFSDLPYNYLVDRDGQIFQGRSGYLGVVPELASQEGVVLVGYLSNGSDVPYQAQLSFANIITDVSKRFGIHKDSVKVVNLQMTKKNTDTNQFTKLKYTESSDLLSQNISKSIESSTYSETQQRLDYSGEIVDLQYESEVKSGTKIDVSLKLKNKNDFPWFTYKEFIYMATESGNDSPLAVNGVWDSFSKPVHIEQRTILPGETQEIKFSLNMPMLPVDSISESFKFTFLPDILIANTKFTIQLQVLKGDYDIVQIVSPDAGYANVRDCASIDCKLLGQVDDGNMYIYVGEESGWYQIKYNGVDDGWVIGSFAKKL